MKTLADIEEGLYETAKKKVSVLRVQDQYKPVRRVGLGVRGPR